VERGRRRVRAQARGRVHEVHGRRAAVEAARAVVRGLAGRALRFGHRLDGELARGQPAEEARQLLLGLGHESLRIRDDLLGRRVTRVTGVQARQLGPRAGDLALPDRVQLARVDVAAQHPAQHRAVARRPRGQRGDARVAVVARDGKQLVVDEVAVSSHGGGDLALDRGDHVALDRRDAGRGPCGGERAQRRCVRPAGGRRGEQPVDRGEVLLDRGARGDQARALAAAQRVDVLAQPAHGVVEAR
jgi:hypothetical protein